MDVTNLREFLQKERETDQFNQVIKCPSGRCSDTVLMIGVEQLKWNGAFYLHVCTSDLTPVGVIESRCDSSR